MICKVCGAENSENTFFCTACGSLLQHDSSNSSVDYGSNDFIPDFRTEEEKNQPIFTDPNYIPPADSIPVTIPKTPQKGHTHRRNKPSLVLRFPLQLLSFALCLVLMVTLLGTALLLDFNRLLSAGGIKQLVSAVFNTSATHNAPARPIVGALGMGMVSEQTNIPVEIPEDIFTSDSSDTLVDWLCQIASQAAGEGVQIDREQMSSFVQNSTLADYIAEKAAGYAEDFIQNTQNTQITTEELQELFEENRTLIEETFRVEITQEMQENINTAIEQAVVEGKLNETIHEQISTTMEETLNTGLEGFDANTLRGYLQLLTSKGLVLGSVALCVVLMLLLCAANFYNLPGGLTWSSVSCIVSGTILSIPLIILQSSPTMLSDLLGIPVAITHLMTSFLSVFSLVHYGILILGIALLLLSIVWRILRAMARPNMDV